MPRPFSIRFILTSEQSSFMGEAAGGESINVLRTTIVKNVLQKTERTLKPIEFLPSFKFKVTKTFKNR